MELNLKRPLLFFDIESTGLNIATDGIIEISFVKVFPDNSQQIKTWKIAPWDYNNHCLIKMNPQAAEVTGITDEMLAADPQRKKFLEIAMELAQWLRDSDLAGFNSAKFDLPILAEEIERVLAYCRMRISDPKVPQDKKLKAREMEESLSSLDLHNANMVDIQTIYHFMEPRNLKAAYRFYCGGKDFDNAHTAEADTLATLEVLKGQLDMYQEPDRYHDQSLKNDVSFLSSLGGKPKSVDFAGRIVMKNGVPTVSFGKYKDRSVKDLYEKDKNYFDWIEKGDFTLDTKAQFRRLYKQYDAEYKAKASKPASAEQLEDLKKYFNR